MTMIFVFCARLAGPGRCSRASVVPAPRRARGYLPGRAELWPVGYLPGAPDVSPAPARAALPHMSNGE